MGKFFEEGKIYKYEANQWWEVEPLSSDAVLGEGWRDANRDCPDDDSPVLVCSKLRDGLFYEVGFWESGRGWAIQGFDSDVIAWKPIDPPAFA